MAIKQKIKFKTASGMKPMTREEEYRNAGVPMPPKKKENTDDKEFLAHLKKFFKG
tara:strand:+ start:51 stop:215 length:165 start_codon:yes stop_codon:yes gene_type:complete